MFLADHAIWWQVYPLNALGAPTHGYTAADHAHRLPGLIPWLGHVQELGCDGILLGPIFESATHGYDTLDHFRIDPRLGDESDFTALIAAAHARGLAVMLDGVFNHVGVNHPLVAETLAGRSHAIRLIDTPTGPTPAPWEGHGDLALLNHDDPAVVDLVTDVMTYWLERGIAGWRLDVAYAVPSHFWREVLARVRATHPDAVFLGEVIHGDYAAIAQEDTLTAVTQYELWKATWSSLKDTNFWELAHALTRHQEFSTRALMQTFVGNHDVTRIASQVGDDGAALAAAILFTVPGMPSVYYGDEEAFRGEKGTGAYADDPIRPPLPATPEQLAPFGAWMRRHYQALIGLRRRHPWLTHGQLTVTGKDNTWITYRVASGARTAAVRLEVGPVPRVRVVVDDGAASETFTWQGGRPAAG